MSPDHGGEEMAAEVSTGASPRLFCAGNDVVCAESDSYVIFRADDPVTYRNGGSRQDSMDQ